MLWFHYLLRRYSDWFETMVIGIHWNILKNTGWVYLGSYRKALNPGTYWNTLVLLVGSTLGHVQSPYSEGLLFEYKDASLLYGSETNHNGLNRFISSSPESLARSWWDRVGRWRCTTERRRACWTDSQHRDAFIHWCRACAWLHLYASCWPAGQQPSPSPIHHWFVNPVKSPMFCE